MAEIGIGVLEGQCVSRRIADRERLEREVAAWQRGRNAAEAKIERMFTTEAARAKLGRFHPHPPGADLPGKPSSLLCRGTSGSAGSDFGIMTTHAEASGKSACREGERIRYER
jgi:hypothetical protein